MRKIRIGIDVGGTFTDAAALDAETMEVIATAKIKTTHTAREGVAAGIVSVLKKLLQENGLSAEQVSFIAHGTTQATNALLEGDVAKTGIVGLGAGLFAYGMAEDTQVRGLELAPGRFLPTEHFFVRTDKGKLRERLAEIWQSFRAAGVEAVAVSEGFGVDTPENEDTVAALARQAGFAVTTGHDVSRLYGLKVCTRTAAVNASLIPRMLETAELTASCVREAEIGAPLMIMRCDGGVMTTAEMKTRPILTLLSGLAAGVAGALMYEKVSTGIFLEAGGTSTDISAIRDGKVMVRTAEAGGHKLYLSALDVRTRGVAGGSMVRVSLAEKKIMAAGPRSAHIAGLAYEVFSGKMRRPRLRLLAPSAGDAADFAAVEDEDGRCAALTLAGAANVLGVVPDGDYAAGDKEAALAAWQALGEELGCTAQEAARQAMECGAAELTKVVQALRKDYELRESNLTLVGGGGSAGVIVPYLAEKLGLPWRLAKHAPIISTIGVALAMVREVVERTVADPAEEDIRSVRREALEALLRAGASPETADVSVEIDRKQNILRAIALGTQAGNNGTFYKAGPSGAQLLQNAVQALGKETAEVKPLAEAGQWRLYAGIKEKRGWFKSKREHWLAVLDAEGVVRLARPVRKVCLTNKAKLQADLRELLETLTEYGTVGGILPKLFAFFALRQADLTGLAEEAQLLAVLEMELADYPEEETVALVALR